MVGADLEVSVVSGAQRVSPWMLGIFIHALGTIFIDFPIDNALKKVMSVVRTKASRSTNNFSTSIPYEKTQQTSSKEVVFPKQLNKYI